MDECVRTHDHNVIVVIVRLVATIYFLFQSLYPKQLCLSASFPLSLFESSSDGHSDQEDSDYDKEEEPLSSTESYSDGDTRGEEESLSAPLPLPRPHSLTASQSADVHRESKLISCCAKG